MSDIFKKLSNGGAFSLPFLLHIYNDKQDVYLINSSKEIVYNNITFLPSTFSYLPKPDGETSLEIELVENGSGLINIFENSYDFKAEFLGVLLENGDIQEISNYFHHYGTATWNGKTANINFTKDDRFNMTFPALIFNAYNNRGNN